MKRKYLSKISLIASGVIFALVLLFALNAQAISKLSTDLTVDYGATFNNALEVAKKVFIDGTTDNAGNVGIGTVAPGAKLDIINDGVLGLRVQGTNTNAMFRLQNTNADGDFLDIETETTGVQLEVNDMDVMKLSDAGNVGIGTTNPGAKLSVIDTIEGYTTGLNVSSFYVPSSTNTYQCGFNWATFRPTYCTTTIPAYGGTTLNGADLGGAARNLVLQTGTGNVGIGSGAKGPNHKLQVDGSIYSSDGIISSKGLTSSNLIGATDNRSVCAKASGELMICNAPINTLTISPNPIAGPFADSGMTTVPGQSTTLTWSSTGNSCVGSSSPFDSSWAAISGTSGTISLNPSVPTTYTLTCSNTAGLTSVTSSVADVRSPQLAYGNGDYNETCDHWLANTGQAGVNGSLPDVRYSGGQYGVAYYGYCFYRDASGYTTHFSHDYSNSSAYPVGTIAGDTWSKTVR